MIDTTTDRDNLIYQLKQFGIPCSRIARCFDISHVRVQQICDKQQIATVFTPKQIRVMHAAHMLTHHLSDIGPVVRRYYIQDVNILLLQRIVRLIEKHEYNEAREQIKSIGGD